MSDDTTTWLKKNTALNPLRRSLKTSLRFHVPNPVMDVSIMSNPDKSKNQEIFIPPMLQRPKTQMRVSRAHQFKIPELVVAKPAKKKEITLSSKVIPKKSSAVPKKSFLPVPKTKASTTEREPVRSNLPRPSLMPGSSARSTTARREIIQKMVELSEVKRTREEVTSQLKITSADNSVLRSILKKKRASLRRTSKTSEKKPKVKKVLFDGFQASFAEENDENASPMEQHVQKDNDFAALDEPTVFFTFPNSRNLTSSPHGLSLKGPEDSSWTVTDNDPHKHSLDANNAAGLLKMWTSYKGNMDSLQSMQDSLKNSLESLLQQTLSFQNKYESFKKDSEEMYASLAKLGNELEENLKKALESCCQQKDSPLPKRRSAGKRLLEKVDKIRLSDKSKAIKRSSGNKLSIKKALIKEMEDSFSLVYKKSLMDNQNLKK